MTMNVPRILAPLFVALFVLSTTAWAGGGMPHGAVFTMTNAADGNAVLMYHRAFDGELTPVGAFATGGLGTGAGLGNQGGLVLDEGNRWLFAVNAGSDEISVFNIKLNQLLLVDTVPSGGRNPVSLATDRNLLYVLNAGGAVGGVDEITGFTISDTGMLSAIPGSTQPLSAASTGPAQISFTPDRRSLVVTEKATNTIDVYPVDGSGVAGAPMHHASEGMTPFGFGFGKRGQLLVSEASGGAADASTISSYEIDCASAVATIEAALPTTESAACWVAVTGDGRFAYTTNTGSGTITGLRVHHDGTLELLHADGVTAETGPGSAPIDLALDSLGLNLYALDSGNGAIVAFRRTADGSLVPLPGAGVDGLPEGTNGLVAR
jgi:6-phosphogluconolactonase (cycloisomerase 2 family)